jgi:enoyl-CoA hydratase
MERYRYLLLEIEAGIATLTINRPQALNAMTRELLEELGTAISRLQDDPAVRVVLLTGSGDKAFVAGADIAAMAGFSPLEARELALLGQRTLAAIEACPLPVIAVVNGFALGGGCELAMACDIRLAADTARLGQPEINLGIIPGFAGSQRLPRLVGKGRALELLLSGEMIGAAEAWRIGLVNRVLPAAELMTEARRLAALLAGKGRTALRLCKAAVQDGLEMDLARGAAYEADLFGLCFADSDQKEGMQAFLEKRPPQFRS